MNRLLVILHLVLFFFSFAGSEAKASEIEFGVIPREDLAQTDYAPDPGAPAFILEKHGTYYLEHNSGFEIVEKMHIRIKILKPTGYDHGNVSIYYPEKLEKFKASTFNLVNGEIVETELDKDEIFDEMNDVFYNVRRFSFPKIKKGSVLEYTYTTRHKNPSVMPTWFFQAMIPLRESTLRVEYPEQFQYRIIVEGTQNVLRKHQIGKAHFLGKYSNFHVYTLVAKDVPSFEEEAYMDSPINYITRADVQLVSVEFLNYSTSQFLTTYDKINKKLIEDGDFGGVLKSSFNMKKIVDETTSGLNEPRQKMMAIHDHVRDNLFWNGKKKVYASKKFNALLFDKTGNNADINLFMVQLLRDAGLDAHPVVLSTFNHGKLNKFYANPRQLNYTIAMVKIDDQKYLLDGTEKYAPWNHLPKRCLNGEGWVVKEGKGYWVPLTNGEEEKIKLIAQLQLSNDGTIEGKLTNLYQGLSADSQREILAYIGFDKYHEVIQDIYGEWIIKDYSLENQDSIKEQLVERIEMTLFGEAINTGDKIYLSPVMLLKEEFNYFYDEDRKFPVNFGCPIAETFLMTLQVPPAYEIEELPESAIIKLPDDKGEYTFRVSDNNNTIQVLSKLKINKPFFKVDEYKYLQQMYNHVIEKQSEMIVLKKKPGKEEQNKKVSSIN